MDLTPSPHWGLGLPCYTFATSPIRRYLDLVIHRQLLAVVSGHPPIYTGPRTWSRSCPPSSRPCAGPGS